MNLRDRVSQAAVVVSDTEYTLTGGAAEAGHLTFEDGFPIPSTGDLGGDCYWDNVPVCVETSAGAWQTLMFTLHRSNLGAIRLMDGVFHSSSTGAALGLAAAAAVTVTLAPLAGLFHSFAISTRPLLGTLPGLQSGGSASLFDTTFVDNGGLMAMGRKCYSLADYSTVTGDDMYAPNECAQYYGFGTAHGAAGAETALAYAQVRAAHTANATPVNMGMLVEAGTPVSGADVFYLDAGIHVFDGFVSAIDLATGDHKVWKVLVTVKTALDYATTDVIGTPVYDVIDASAGAATWALAMVGDDAENEAYFQITGEAATNISWCYTGRQHHHVVYP
jgi:hypothetical protein